MNGGNLMVTIEDAQEMLDEIAESLPQELYKELNGGILLIPEAKRSAYSINNDLYTMGEYHHSGSMGRIIYIYFGSFEKLYSNISKEVMRQKLRDTLLHEFTHHLESLAGEKGLEKKDEEQLRKYQARYKRD
jgi:predicted Zn-dependent protease with MMP-like domain